MCRELPALRAISTEIVIARSLRRLPKQITERDLWFESLGEPSLFVPLVCTGCSLQDVSYAARYA
ncbi:hypothetical protein BH24ACT15_BH24ACT15_37500 [soil metagenome]